MKTEMNISDNETEVKVSVCCAAYNHAKYIEQTLQGFVMQHTSFRFEVIVHDDASTDNTKSIIQKYVELYPDLFVPIYETENQYSKGRGMVSHIMYSKAKGRYIALCEGDDYWIDENKLQKQYEALEKNTDCSICVHGIKHIFEDRALVETAVFKMSEKKNGYNLHEGIIEKEQIASALWLQGGYPFHTCSYFIRKCVFDDKLNNNAEFIKYMNGDIATLRQCLLYGKFYYINEVMACRRRGVSGSWSAKWKNEKIQAKLEHYRRLIIGEKLFDEYANYQFHEYISIHIFNLAAECCIYDTANIKRIVKENPLSIKIIHDKKNLWTYIRYLIIRVSPKLYKLLYDMQTKVMKK